MSGRRATARRSSEPDGGSVGEVSAAPQFADVSRRGLAADPNTVVTPEAVLLSQPVAAVPSRLLARVIDLLLQLVIILVALVAAARQVIYGRRGRAQRVVVSFFTVGFPLAVTRAWRAIAFSALLFFGSALATGLWFNNSPQALDVTVSPEQQELSLIHI